MVQGTQSVRADDEPDTRPIIGEEGSILRLTTTERRLKPRTSPESQPRIGFTGALKKFCPSSFFLRHASPSGLSSDEPQLSLALRGGGGVAYMGERH